MAGGILSIAAAFSGQSTLSMVLLAAAAIAFIVLAALNVVSAAIHPDSIRDARLALVLLTWVAACGVLGDSRGPLPEMERLGLAGFAVVGWILGVLTFALLLDRGAGGWRSWKVSGSWLLAVVATQSLAILAGAAAEGLDYGPLVAFGVALWIVGLVTYCVLIALIVRRLARGAVAVDMFTPDYWITMGALAISTVAALDLSRSSAGLGLIGGLSGELPAIALVTWVGGAAWIPYLLLLELARVRIGGLSLRYDPVRWSTVFPLGMFSLASHELEATVRLPALEVITTIAFWVGLALALLNLGRAAGTLAKASKRIC